MRAVTAVERVAVDDPAHDELGDQPDRRPTPAAMARSRATSSVHEPAHREQGRPADAEWVDEHGQSDEEPL